MLIAGCAHRGMVNICAAAKEILGKAPDVALAGFHLFQLSPDQQEAQTLIAQTGAALLQDDTVYYTGHCTGEFAFSQLSAIMGERLKPITGGGCINL